MNDIEKWKMAFGFAILFIFAGLILAIGLGKVEEKTSYGLMPMIVALAGLMGQWAGSVFGHNKKGD